MANTVEIIFRGVDQISQNTSRIDRSFQTLRRTAFRLAGALAAAFSVREIVRAADTMRIIENRIRLVTDSTEELNTVQQRLFDISQSTRTSFEAIVQLYGRAGLAASELGASQEELLKFTELVGQGLAIQGGNADTARGALLQLAQALGSGIVRAEEFNSILEGAFPIAQAAARGIDRAGGSVARLRQLIISGEITSREFFNALLSQSKETGEIFAETESTIGQALGKLGDSFTVLVANVTEATGASNLLTTSLEGLASAAQDLNDSLFPDEMQELQNRLTDIREEIEGLTSGAGTAFGGFLGSAGIEGQTERLAALRAELIEVVKQITNLRRQREKAALDLSPITIDTEGLNEKLDEALEEMRLAGQEKIDDLFEHFTDRYATAQQQVAAEMDRFDAVAHLFPPEEQERIRRAIREPLFAGIEEIDLSELIDIEELDRNLEDALNTTTAWEKRMESIADEAARSMQRAFSDFFFDPFADGLEGMVKGFLNAIRRMVADEAAVRLFKVLFGRDGKGGDSDGGGLLGGIFSAIGTAFGGGRAHGGFTVPGSLHPVNEREPEFLLTRGRSEVVPLSKMAASGAGGGSNVFSPTTTFQLMTAPLTRDQLEEFSQSREDMMFAKFKRMLRDDGID